MMMMMMMMMMMLVVILAVVLMLNKLGHEYYAVMSNLIQIFLWAVAKKYKALKSPNAFQ